MTSVYFIADASHRYVKIGVSKSPTLRLVDLQAGSPLLLEIVCVVNGWGKSEEVALHQHFAGNWLHREWFNFSDELKDLIADWLMGAPIVCPPCRYPNNLCYDAHGAPMHRNELMATLKSRWLVDL